MRPGLTVVVLFRDGEEILRRCISSVIEIADEIIAVNTGCTDNSSSLASKLGCKVVDFPWTDAFDEAYNFGFSQVETEWTFWIDSDEWFFAESTDLLKKAINHPDGFAYTVIRVDDLGNGSFSEMRQPRIWRTHPKMQLVGTIHAQFHRESLVEAAGERKLIHTGIRIGHDGFKGGISQEKLVRNLKLLEKEIAIRPGNLYFEISYCENLLLLNDERGVAMLHELLRRAFVDGERPQEIFAGLLAAGVRMGLPDDFSLDKATEIALSKFPNHPNLMWELANALLVAGDLKNGRKVLDQLQSIATTGNYSRHALFDASLFGNPLNELISEYEKRTCS